MHPTYVSDRPGDCPICGMRLVPIGESTHSTNGLPGRVPVSISPEKRQTIGLTFSPVEPRELRESLRTAGVVVHDETRLARIAPRFAGWIKSLKVNFTGQEVRKGEPLFSYYSPEVFTAANEYLITLQNARLLEKSTDEQRRSAEVLVQAARRRLELLEVAPEEIKSMEQTGQAPTEIQMRSPTSGHVITKNAVEGRSFSAGEPLYEIADLSHLWVRAFLFEYELPQVRLGQPATITFPALSGLTYTSSVAFIDPHIDPQTRRAEVRLELDNPKHRIRRDMWADVQVESQTQPVLAVPASAVIDTGTRQLAFVEAQDHTLEPREVKLGIRTEDYVQVLDGLRAGEKVVTRSLFLIDSESQLKAAIAGMVK